MKTVITDNSLCTLPFAENTPPEFIYKYIEALAETGVKYLEIDFRTVMKMKELPSGVGYIFRLSDPMFANLTSVFDFSYVVVTVRDLKQRLSLGGVPVIMEFPAMREVSSQLLGLAQNQLSEHIEMVRLRGSYLMMDRAEVLRMIWRQRNAVAVPVDICPMNRMRSALDTAIKATLAKVDSVTMCMGRAGNYASIEEYLFALMSVYEMFPEDYNVAALCKAEIFHHLVFGKYSSDCISDIMRLLDEDIRGLRNADTGERVNMKVSLKDKLMLHHTFVTALEKLIESEDIPDYIADDISDAIQRYDASLFDMGLMYETKRGLLQ